MRYLSAIIISCFAACATPKKEVHYKIAYNVNLSEKNKENYDIFVIDINGGKEVNVNNSSAIEWTYYAQKDRLFYISDEDTSYKCYFLYEMDANGNGKKKVSELRLEDSWMSSRNDGKELIVTGRSGMAARYQLFIIDTRTGKYKQLTHDTAARYGDPVFSPDGKRIAFIYKKHKRDTATHEELYIMNADGSNMQQLSHYPENDPALKTHEYKAGSPRWYPDGSFITYISFQNGRSNIYKVTPDGKQHSRLTDNDMNEGWHDWSDDGKWLAFDNYNENEQYHIMLMNMQTKKVKQLTDSVHKAHLSPVFVRSK